MQYFGRCYINQWFKKVFGVTFFHKYTSGNESKERVDSQTQDVAMYVITNKYKTL